MQLPNSMKTINALLFSLITSIFLLQGCAQGGSNCPGPSYTFYHILPQDKAFFLYKGYDTISFTVRGSVTYTLSFYGQGVDSVYNSKGVNGNYDCPENQIQYREVKQVKFKSPNFTGPLVYSIGVDIYDMVTSSITISFKGWDFNTDIDFPPYPNPGYIDSMTVNNKTYYQIVSVFHDSYNHSDTLYYNKFQGIIKMSFSDGQIWERMP